MASLKVMTRREILFWELLTVTVWPRLPAHDMAWRNTGRIDLTQTTVCITEMTRNNENVSENYGRFMAVVPL